MADESMGQFKYVISADYSQLMDAMQSISDKIKQQSDNIAQSISGITSAFDNLGNGSNIESASSKLNSLQDTLGKLKAQSSTSQDGFTKLADNISKSGDRAKESEGKYKTLAQQMNEARLASEKAWGNMDFSSDKGNYQNLANTLALFNNELKTSDILAKQNAASSVQYWKDQEAQMKRNSALLKEQMELEVKENQLRTKQNSVSNAPIQSLDKQLQTAKLAAEQAIGTPKFLEASDAFGLLNAQSKAFKASLAESTTYIGDIS